MCVYSQHGGDTKACHVFDGYTRDSPLMGGLTTLFRDLCLLVVSYWAKQPTRMKLIVYFPSGRHGNLECRIGGGFQRDMTDTQTVRSGILEIWGTSGALAFARTLRKGQRWADGAASGSKIVPSANPSGVYMRESFRR